MYNDFKLLVDGENAFNAVGGRSNTAINCAKEFENGYKDNYQLLLSVGGGFIENEILDYEQIVYEFTVPSNSTANLIVEKEIQKLPDGIIKTEKGYKCVSGKYKITLI